MKTNISILLLITSISFFACTKKSDDNSNSYGTKKNTWTFTQGSTVHKGISFFGEGASLTTTANSSNGAYNFAFLGVDEETGFFFNVFLHLKDTTFTVKTYQSGVEGNVYLNAFYYTQFVGVTEDTYQSSNQDPGPVMNYTITAYDPAANTVTIEFSGEAFDISGTNKVPITNGKFTVSIDK